MSIERFSFETLPNNIETLKTYNIDSPYKTAALAMVVLKEFSKNQNNCFDMIDYLKGPDSLSPMAKQFLVDRLRGKEYKVDSFFLGSSPENNYKPNEPYTIEIFDNPYSFVEDNYAVLYVKSSGADSERSIKLRKKPSTGEWFLIDYQCLSDIRIPISQDAWA